MALFLCAAALTLVLDTTKEAFDAILQIGAGTGLLYLVRWFWWRVNAYCEVVAMISSFAVSLAILFLHKAGILIDTHTSLLVTIAITTCSWLIAAYAAPQTDKQTLLDFYKLVRPFGPGWNKIKAELAPEELAQNWSNENFPLALLAWVSGCTLIWSSLFAIGNFLYFRHNTALLLTALALLSGYFLVITTSRLWSKNS